ncbi:synaptonemal complex protein 3 [Neosynchiropus ocellatus]
MSGTVRRQKKKKEVEVNPQEERSEIRSEQEPKRCYNLAEMERKDVRAPDDGRRVQDHSDPPYKKRRADFQGKGTATVGVEVHSMLERFGADISKVMQAKKKHLEGLTKTYMKGSQQKLEQLWNHYHGQRKKMTQQYSEQVSAALQQWETEAQRAEEQEDKMNNLFKQQQRILQHARLHQNQKLKVVRELYEQFVKNMEEMETSHESFLQEANQELRKEMSSLQKKILMDTQQQDLATVRKSLQTMLF